jgi:hypothetical protein
MGTVQVIVRDAALTEQVLPLLAESGVTAVPQRDEATRLIVCDPQSLPSDPGGYGPPVVVVAGGSQTDVWRRLAGCAVEQVVPLPDGADLLRRRLRQLADPRPRPGRLVRVVGVRGGCGATTLAVGLAAAMAQLLPTALVDADPHGPGVELALGLTGAGGIRWKDLADVRGRLPVTTLTSRLPRAGGLAVLSHRAGDPLDVAAAWAPTVESLFGGFGGVVADVPRHQLERLAPVGNTRDILALPLDLAGLTCARRLVDAAAVAPNPVLAVRRAAVGPIQFGAVIDAFPGADVVAVPAGRALAGAADFGDLAEVVVKGGFGRLCRALAGAIVEPVPPGMSRDS